MLVMMTKTTNMSGLARRHCDDDDDDDDDDCSNCKRTKSSESRFSLCKKYELLLRSLLSNYTHAFTMIKSKLALRRGR